MEQLRNTAGLTHEELSDRIGVSFQRISELERGVANPTFSTLIMVAAGLGVKLSDLARLIDEIRDEGGREAEHPSRSINQRRRR